MIFLGSQNLTFDNFAQENVQKRPKQSHKRCKIYNNKKTLKETTNAWFLYFECTNLRILCKLSKIVHGRTTAQPCHLEALRPPQMSFLPFLATLKCEVKDNDDDNGRHYQYSCSETQDVFNLGNVIRLIRKSTKCRKFKKLSNSKKNISSHRTPPRFSRYVIHLLSALLWYFGNFCCRNFDNENPLFYRFFFYLYMFICIFFLLYEE